MGGGRVEKKGNRVEKVCDRLPAGWLRWDEQRSAGIRRSWGLSRRPGSRDGREDSVVGEIHAFRVHPTGEVVHRFHRPSESARDRSRGQLRTPAQPSRRSCTSARNKAPGGRASASKFKSDTMTVSEREQVLVAKRRVNVWK